MRTNNLQMRYQLRSTVKSLLDNIVNQNNISSIDMEEAVEHYLLELREAATEEYVQWSMLEKAKMIEQYEQNMNSSEEGEEPEPQVIEEE